MSETVKETTKKKKKKGAFARYFTPFGLRQVCDLLMIFGAIMMFIGLFVHGFMGINIVVLIGLGMYVVASLLAMFRCLKVITNKEISKKSMERKRAVTNIIIMSVILALAVVGILAAVLGW